MAKYNVVIETEQSRDVLQEILNSILSAQPGSYNVVSVQERK